MAKIQKNLTVPHASEDVKQQEHSFIACGDAKWNDHVGSQFGSFLQNQTYSHHTIRATTLLDVYTVELKAVSTQKPARECYISFIQNQCKLEVTKISFNGWMDKHSVDTIDTWIQ